MEIALAEQLAAMAAAQCYAIQAQQQQQQNGASLNMSWDPNMHMTNPMMMPVAPPPPVYSPSAINNERSQRQNSEDQSRRDREKRKKKSRDRSNERDSSDRSSSRRRDRDHRDRKRDRSRSSDRSRRERRRDRSPQSDDDHRDISPNNTVMLRGLGLDIAEHDIRQDIANCGLISRDIRLIRKKETGASRGFAFVEFNSISEAEKWMDAKQGVLILKDDCRASMQYSLPRDGRPGELPKVLHDWICANCGVQNFRRRDHCFKCNGPKTDGGAEGADEVSSHPTGIVLLRNLDALTTEESVLKHLRTYSELPIKSIRIGRDPLTNMSRGVCYVEMNTVMDSMFLHNHLLGNPPIIDEKLVSVSYYRNPQSIQGGQGTVVAAAANAALAAAQWSHQGKLHQPLFPQQQDTTPTAVTNPYNGNNSKSAEEIERLAEYSASLYAKTPEEKQSYLEYYRNYYKNGGDNNNASGSSNSNSNGTQASNEAHAGMRSTVDLGTVSVGDIEYKKYPEPDISSYVFEESSGYYYDTQTGLYYDSASQYYYNSTTTQYLYWSAKDETYLPAPNSADDDKTKDEGEEGEKNNDKVKIAKKIAKDMEKWAKMLNQKKDSIKPNTKDYGSAPVQNSDSKPNGSVDIAFSMLQNKKPNTLTAATSSNNSNNLKPTKSSTLSSMGSLAGLASYGSDSEEESSAGNGGGGGRVQGQGGTSGPPSLSQLTDWNQLACLLCKRQFPSKEKLEKHNQKSDLHKTNLAGWQKQQENRDEHQQPSSSAENKLSFQYRDRAKERRLKYGEDDAPKPNKLKEKYLRAMEVVETTSTAKINEKKSLDSSNIGNKMLQKMGWKDGMGLGKSNHGRTSIIEVERRSALAGLGSAGSVKGGGAGDSYKDALKKTLFSRYDN